VAATHWGTRRYLNMARLQEHEKEAMLPTG